MADVFTPATCLTNPHLQTLWPFVAKKTTVLIRHRERYQTPDGDFFDVDWSGEGKKGVVILIHGLTGCSESHYILDLQSLLLGHGYSTAALNFRACSGQPNLKAGSYHAGFTKDLQQLYQNIREKDPAIPVFTVGFSLGGNIMLKWLSEQAKQLTVNAAVAISVPYKLANCADKVDTGLSRLYRAHLITLMKNKLALKRTYFKVSQRFEELKKLEALGDLRWIKSFWAFDHHVVAPLHGFADVHDYYRQCSSMHYLKDITIKTLLIHALDDPLMTPDVLPDKSQLGEQMDLLITEKGGHVGFLHRTAAGNIEPWLPSVVLNYLQEQR